MKINKQGRYIGIDILRVIAMLSVIFLHTIYSFTVRGDFFLTKAWFIFEPLSALSRSSLALFFIISGYLVIHKNRTVGENLTIVYQRIFVPFIYFSILASLFFLWKTGQSITQAISMKYIFADVMKFPDNWLWFLSVLLFLHLLNPLWQLLFLDRSKRLEARYIVLFFFIFTLCAVFLKFSTHSLSFFNSFTTWTGYVCCYLYGALVRNKWNTRRSNIFYILLFFSGLLIEIGGDYFSILSQKNGTPLSFAGYFSDNIAIAPLMMAIGLFNIIITLKKISIFNRAFSHMLQKIVEKIALLSYGVYLTHKFISEYITDIVGLNVDSVHVNVYIFNIGLFTITLFGSLAITYIISIIPKLRLIIGEN